MFWQASRQKGSEGSGRQARREVRGSVLGVAHAPSLRDDCAGHTIPPCRIPLPHIQGSKGCSSSFLCPPQPPPSAPPSQEKSYLSASCSQQQGLLHFLAFRGGACLGGGRCHLHGLPHGKRLGRFRGQQDTRQKQHRGPSSKLHRRVGEGGGCGVCGWEWGGENEPMKVVPHVQPAAKPA